MSVHSANYFNFLQSDMVIVDANIWTYINGFNQNHDSKNDFGYSQVLYEHIYPGSIYVNNQIISEFIHTNMKIAYKMYCRKNGKCVGEFQYKKDYQRTEDYKKKFHTILETVSKEILPIVKFFDIKEQDVKFSVENNIGLNDFNDCIIFQCAKNNSAKILTHDADFSVCAREVDILSNNVSMKKV